MPSDRTGWQWTSIERDASLRCGAPFLRHRLSSPFQWSVFSTSKTVDAALYDLHPATEPAGLGWTGGQAGLNPSRFRWASHLNGRRVFFMSVFAVSPGGCRPSMIAVTMSGAR